MTPVTRNLLFQRRQKRRVRRMASWCMATRCCSAWRCGAAALRDRYQLCDIYDPLGSNATISGLCHRQRPNRLQHPQFSGVGMSGGVDKRGGCSEPQAWAEREPWHMGARGVRRGRLVVARLCLDAFPGARRWQNAREMRFRALEGGRIAP